MRQIVLAALVAAIGLSAPTVQAATAKPAAQQQSVALDVKVRDLSPRFLEFYETAGKPAPAPADANAPVESEGDRRWRLFKRDYDFSAQPDEAAARAALEAAWPRYAAALPRIEAGFDGIASEPTTLIDQLSKQFFLGQPMSLRLVTYVGAFEGKVWSRAEPDALNVYLPLEVDAAARALPTARVLGGAILAKSAGWGAQPRNLAEQVIAEGVLAQALRTVVPGRPLEAYLDLSAEELAQARAALKTDFRALQDKLADGSADTLALYAGDKRATARLAGWLLVERFQVKKKARYADMIRQRPADLVKVSREQLGAEIRAAK
ncbi:hypothetical protein [Chitinimonas koreensis]|uniref:hypothetical protein n=1 Tax=Chitinimonas koreensis TaxID=356302 RepID=UPI000415E762|nr:hypothetical protein [Chitinimonas koreensis]QNM98150.1 hypothetical protein H9L41_07850 [Chitinimonas koreensis]